MSPVRPIHSMLATWWLGECWGWLSLFVFSLTANAICVVIRFTEEVWYGHQQRSQAGQQGTTPDEPRPVDSAPEKAHKNDENRVAHLQWQTSVWKLKVLQWIGTGDAYCRGNELLQIQTFAYKDLLHIVKTHIHRYTHAHKNKQIR